ncbi:4-hydroxy-tetrahydrodipicolinate reductase [Tahibacter amnicola]|uniref:4-hydroxy-tetrahydrodipicolinate reductase n=1 Tax=Tahibacter amnicola TaxID=2976241 RepID=A0ABY6B972_9GAMM|nr:4-hydroxy-tetrahydrodipicolinate reductase [Tahibacter amnicola]UXI66419.1 4-hydroxy-tetrahydrodipicolinate reductase [Tahibacter amnicola]
MSLSSQTPTMVAVHGAGGRMGQAILRAAPLQSDVRISAALVRPGSSLEDTPISALVGNDVADIDFRASLDPDTQLDALIDFSSPHAFDSAIALAVERRVAFICGTTGLSEQQHVTLHRAAQHIPVLWASNFSLGIALMQRFARMAAQLLPTWDCEIVEMHHRRKVDAPSGTALTLGEAVAAGRGVALQAAAVHGRVGRGSRKAGEIGFHALRGGDVIGEHTVMFVSEDERIELTHRANNRDIFAKGALVGAQRLARAAPGMYGMHDLLDE